MDIASIIFAGFLYITTPGPVFLATITTISEKGIPAAIKLMSGAIVGCAFWLFFTSASFIEADKLPPIIFESLTLACGLYLFFLAYKMARHAHNPAKEHVFHRPIIDGMTLSFLNPKAYPVMLSVFSAIILNAQTPLTWHDFPWFFLAALCGFICGYVFMLAFFSLPIFTKLYLKHKEIISYAFALIYCGFGGLLITSLF